MSNPSLSTHVILASSNCTIKKRQIWEREREREMFPVDIWLAMPEQIQQQIIALLKAFGVHHATTIMRLPTNQASSSS
jgi:hypothetical protein